MDDFYSYNSTQEKADDLYFSEDKGDWSEDPFNNGDLQDPWGFDPFSPDAEVWDSLGG